MGIKQIMTSNGEILTATSEACNVGGNVHDDEWRMTDSEPLCDSAAETRERLMYRRTKYLRWQHDVRPAPRRWPALQQHRV
jgi:hypothetical protein